MSGVRVGLFGLLLGLVGCADESFEVQGVELGPETELALNQPIVLEFSAPPEARSLTSPALRLRDRDGGPDGRFRVEVEGRRATLRPSHPCLPDGSDAGLRPGRHYVLELAGPPSLRCVRTRHGRLLDRAFAREFRTAAPTGADWRAALIDPVPGEPPRLESSEFHAPDRLLLRFSEPLDPRALAEAEFRLRGPWDPPPGSPEEIWERRVPRLEADLVDNDARALVELRLAMDPPPPLRADQRAWVDFDPGQVRDFDGRALAGEVVVSTSSLLRWPGPDLEDEPEMRE